MRGNLILFRKSQKPTPEEISKRPAGSKNYKGLLQYEMAARLRITRVHYCRLENGKNEPSIGLLENMLNEFPGISDIWEVFKKN